MQLNINRFIALIALAWLILPPAAASQSPVRENPLLQKRWLNVSAGLNTADNLSWQSAVSWSVRGESILTSTRLAYSQELIEAEDDSIFFRKNRLAEVGMMWGDGWAGRNWYAVGMIGMGLNVRMYGDSALQDETSFRYLTAVTIGVPAQIEAGILFTDELGINLTLIGNWNFRQPYVGAHLGVVWRFRKSSGS